MTDFLEQITGRPAGPPVPVLRRRPGWPGRGHGPHAQPQRSRRARAPATPGDARNGLRQLIDKDLARELLGPEAAAELEELKRLTTLLQESGLAKQGRRDLELHCEGHTPHRRSVHCATCSPSCVETASASTTHTPAAPAASSSPRPSPGSSAIRSSSTSAPALATPCDAPAPAFRSRSKPPTSKCTGRESLITSSTVIAVDMSRSMFNNGAFYRGETRRPGAKHADQDKVPARLPGARRVLLLRDGAAPGPSAAIGLGGLERHQHRSGAGEGAANAEQAEVDQPPDHPDHGLAPDGPPGARTAKKARSKTCCARSSDAPAPASRSTRS